jgi:hypothetical protein
VRFLLGVVVGALVAATCIGTFHGPLCSTVSGTRGFAVICR